MEKIIVAPQIVIYKGIFEHSQGLIDTLNDNKALSFFSDWRPWYDQGIRKEASLTDTIYDLNSVDPQLINEHKYLKEIMDIVYFIQNDYFDQFEKDKGIWPAYIQEWDKLRSKRKLLYIDFFKYDVAKIESNNRNDVLMDYHVDEFLMPSEKKSKRHVITINLYLNDEYSGGEICAYDSISKKIYSFKPSPGDIIVMPSTEPFYHAVNNIFGSDRYFLRTFIDYQTEQKLEYTEEDLATMFDGMDIKEQEYVNNHMQSIKLSLSDDIEVINV